MLKIPLIIPWYELAPKSNVFATETSDLQQIFVRMRRQLNKLSANFRKIAPLCNGKIPFKNLCICIVICVTNKI